MTVGFALHQLLDVAQHAAIPRYAGYVIATTLFGWATGGVIGGVIADYIGRKRTMILAILAYSLTSGLSALAWSWESLAILRFLVGVAIGSEWATGASIVAELWPDHARGKGGGLMQCGAGVGAILASGVWLLIGGTGPNAWRWMYLVGALPALATFWIRRGIPESPKWEQSNERRREAQALKRHGTELSGEAAALTRFTLVDLFVDRSVRRSLIGSFLMMLSVTFAFWGVSTFVPTYVGSIAAKAGLPAAQWAGLAVLVTGACGVLAFVSQGFLADFIGRRATAMLFYLMCLILTPVVYLSRSTETGGSRAARASSWLFEPVALLTNSPLPSARSFVQCWHPCRLETAHEHKHAGATSISFVVRERDKSDYNPRTLGSVHSPCGPGREYLELTSSERLGIP